MLEDLSHYISDSITIPVTLVLVVPLLILVSPATHPAWAAHEFGVYRMQQFDLYGSRYGCRNALVSVEARTSDAKHLTRKCVVSRMLEYSWERHKQALTQSAAAILLILPPSLNKLTTKERQFIEEIEQQLLLDEETNVPVYFTTETTEITEIYNQLQSNAQAETAATAVQAMISAVLGNGYQIVVGTGSQQSKDMPEHKLYNIIGSIGGSGVKDNLPTVVIVAHYDTFGVTAGLSHGVESNGSGVIALLELARILSKLYSNNKTRAKYNLIFALTSGGKFGYQGARKWIEENQDNPDDRENQLSHVSFVLCLDTVGGVNRKDPLYLHVSKPPKETSPPHTLLQGLSKHGVEMVHKKIRRSDEIVAWEHEMFNIRKLPAMTISRLSSHQDVIRKTITDTNMTVDIDVLCQHISVIATSLTHFLYGVDSDRQEYQLISEDLEVNREHVESWVRYFSETSRAAQLITVDSSILNSLKQALTSFTTSTHVMAVPTEKDYFMFYTMSDADMFAYSVKPAVFDLFLAILIGAYLAGVYFFILNFTTVSSLLRKSMVMQSNKIKDS